MLTHQLLEVIRSLKLTSDENNKAERFRGKFIKCFVLRVTDITAPVITLNGDAQITVEVGSTYTDLGATASDNYDGDIESLI